MDSMAQTVVGNCYPACPQPDKAIGLPPHTDPGFSSSSSSNNFILSLLLNQPSQKPGLMTFLINNGVEGLQIEHDGKWYNVQSW